MFAGNCAVASMCAGTPSTSTNSPATSRFFPPPSAFCWYCSPGPATPKPPRGPAHDFGQEACEFYALMLLSIAGIFLVAGANDIMLLFLGIELASIPTYIMVSISRPLAVAQEAGVKYFFLGAMAAALMLFGFSYLYGTTGTTRLGPDRRQPSIPTPAYPPGKSSPSSCSSRIRFQNGRRPPPLLRRRCLSRRGYPRHRLSQFRPQDQRLRRIAQRSCFAVTGGTWHIAPEIVKLLWILAALTMTVGNVLGLVQIQHQARFRLQLHRPQRLHARRRHRATQHQRLRNSDDRVARDPVLSHRLRTHERRRLRRADSPARPIQPARHQRRNLRRPRRSGREHTALGPGHGRKLFQPDRNSA